jgi:anaphase-promoting complex subunit 2
MLPALKDMAPIGNLDNGFARVFSKKLSSVFIYSLPMEDVYSALTLATQSVCIRGFQLSEGDLRTRESNREWSSDLMLLYEALQRLGLGGAPAVRAVAKAMEFVIALFIRSRLMEVDWINKEPVTDILRFWVKEGLAVWVKAAAKILDPNNGMDIDEEAKQWLAMGIDELGKSRVNELFGFVCRWPQSLGALLDIKVCQRLHILGFTSNIIL